MAHTPGPWTFDDTLPNRSIAITANGGIEKIAKVADSFDNARLIAAAPDLLAALQTLLEVPQLHGGGTSTAFPHIKRARAAITKAERG